MVTRLERPPATPRSEEQRDPALTDPPLRTGRVDLCRARPGSLTEHIGVRLGHLHPLTVGALVVVVGFALLATLAVAVGVLLTDVVLPGGVQRWDAAVIEDFVAARPGLNTASLVGSYLAEFVTVLVVVGATVAISVWQRWWSLAALAVIAISLEGLSYLVATYFVSRTRPDVVRLENLVVDDSYPSGHVAAGVVIWLVVAFAVWNSTRDRRTRAVVAVVAVIAPVVVALSRMYRGMHHPTDVAVGYAIGVACVGIALVTVRVVSVVRDRRANPRGAGT